MDLIKTEKQASRQSKAANDANNCRVSPFHLIAYAVLYLIAFAVCLVYCAVVWSLSLLRFPSVQVLLFIAAVLAICSHFGLF